MDIFLSIVALLLALTGIVGCFIPVVPGPIVSYAGLLCAYFCSYSKISTATLCIWLVATIAVTAADYFLPAYMTRLFGGSRAGALGATIGAIVGLFVYPPLTIILGPFFGALIGELIHNHRQIGKALYVGLGSFLSFLIGTGVKLILSTCILLRICIDLVPVVSDWIGSLCG